MTPRARRSPKRNAASRWTLLAVVFALLVARDAPARVPVPARTSSDVVLTTFVNAPRTAAWAAGLGPIEFKNVNTGAVARLGLYDQAGDVDDEAKGTLERVSARDRDGEPHHLSARLEQLLFKVAYHFGGAPLTVVSAWRRHAGRHTAGEAVDFKLGGVRPGEVAAYLRGLPRVGVGIYTHPDTQFVHLDVREQSFHWVDGSAPGVKGRERAIADRGAAKRDAAYTPEMDLPLDR